MLLAQPDRDRIIITVGVGACSAAEVAALLLLALAVEAAATDPSRDPPRTVQALWFDRDRPGIGKLRFAFRTPSPAGDHGLAVMRGAYLLALEG